MTIHRIFLLGGLLSICLIAGCADALKTPYPAKVYFLIDPGEPNPAGAAASNGKRLVDADGSLPGPKKTDVILRVRQLHVASPYDEGSFVYKIGRNQYSRDYYTAFLISTDEMLSSGVCAWLGRTGLFSQVVDGKSSVRTRYSLEGNVTHLYADFTDAHSPHAVMNAQFFLLSDEDSGSKIRFAKSYFASMAVTDPSPAGIVEALNRAFREVLEELTDDLSQSL